jgi:hypothetical protein
MSGLSRRKFKMDSTNFGVFVLGRPIYVQDYYWINTETVECRASLDDEFKLCSETQPLVFLNSSEILRRDWPLSIIVNRRHSDYSGFRDAGPTHEAFLNSDQSVMLQRLQPGSDQFNCSRCASVPF